MINDSKREMKQILKQFLRQFDALGEAELEELSNLLVTEEVKPNTLLVREGQPCQLCYFVLQGCLRQYVVQDGVEKTIAIYTENQAVNYFTSQGAPHIAESYLSSLEPSVIMVGNPADDQQLFARFPVLVEITRKMMEADLGRIQNDLANTIVSNPEQRYLKLLNDRPDLFQRVPLHMIASYLGITPESLSRLRKRLQQRKL